MVSQDHSRAIHVSVHDGVYGDISGGAGVLCQQSVLGEPQLHSRDMRHTRTAYRHQEGSASESVSHLIRQALIWGVAFKALFSHIDARCSCCLSVFPFKKCDIISKDIFQIFIFAVITEM